MIGLSKVKGKGLLLYLARPWIKKSLVRWEVRDSILVYCNTGKEADRIKEALAKGRVTSFLTLSSVIPPEDDNKTRKMSPVEIEKIFNTSWGLDNLISESLKIRKEHRPEVLEVLKSLGKDWYVVWTLGENFILR